MRRERLPRGRKEEAGNAASRAGRRALAWFLGLAVGAALFVPQVQAQEVARWWDPGDPRIGLEAGLTDAGEASWNMELLANVLRPDGFFDPENPGDLNLANSDLAFQGNLVFVGNFHGINIYDVSNPANPVLRTSIICPGGQGDVSVYRNLLFMSVEQTRGRIDCGAQGTEGRVDPERFRGVRVFDISDLDNPHQVAAVQTCRGSHTHTLLQDRSDPDNVYIYVSGAAAVRPAEELAGCLFGEDVDPDESALFRIEVIRVPLARPQDAEVVSKPRVFADRETGAVAGLWPGGAHGEGTQRSSQTNHCHDITVYEDLGLAAGACSGNGILLDISDPVNPVRVDEVIDENFAYWHSAAFNNDGTSVIFTDEWGGGTSPRCRATDLPEWGANAIFQIRDGRMERVSYYKLPVPQTSTENCVAHNGSLVPVPGRDIKVQSWYQGGISVFDFTDPANPHEIAFFDRGPISDERLVAGGHWSAYWYNGHIYGSEIARGLDVLRLTPGEHLSENELEAALLVEWDEFNPQDQPRMTWPAAWPVARAYVDQLERSQAMDEVRAASLRTMMDMAETATGAQRQRAMDGLWETLGELRVAAAWAGTGVDGRRLSALVETLDELVRVRE